MRVSDEISMNNMRVNKGSVPYIEINKYYYQKIFHYINKEPFHIHWIYSGKSNFNFLLLADSPIPLHSNGDRTVPDKQRK